MNIRTNIDTKQLETLIKNIKLAKDTKISVKVGVLNGGSEMVDGTTVAGYGLFNEMGSITRNLPQRSFIKKPLEKHLKEQVIKISHNLSKLILEENNIKLATERLGIIGTNIIKKAFRNKNDGEWKPNAPSTIKKKGVDNALIDEGRLIKTIDYEVIQNG